MYRYGEGFYGYNGYDGSKYYKLWGGDDTKYKLLAFMMGLWCVKADLQLCVMVQL